MKFIATIALVLFTFSASALAQPVFTNLYYDGHVVGTVIPPAAAPMQGKDNIYPIFGGVGGQLRSGGDGGPSGSGCDDGGSDIDSGRFWLGTCNSVSCFEQDLGSEQWTSLINPFLDDKLDDLKDIKAKLTMVGGQVVWEGR